jgi:predicted nucleic acid-binding protein
LTFSRVGGVRRVFVDSSAFFAMLDGRDNNNGNAVAIMRNVSTQRVRFVTSNFVVAEAHGLALGRLGRDRALSFLETVDASTTEVLRVTPEDEQRAREIIQTYDDKRFSLTDAISFSIMDRLGMREAFAFDINFVQYGFLTLQP